MTPDPLRVVEAALFSSGKPLAVEEIAQATGLPAVQVRDALKALHTEYDQRGTALEVVKSGVKWAMAVRAAYSEATRMLAAAEIPRKVLKTLALIAFHQPIKQSDLKGMIGSVVYDHVHELHERGMVTARQDGVTKVLSTTDRFVEYFGLDASNPDELRRVLARRVGLELPEEDAAVDPAQSRLPDEAATDEAARDADAADDGAAPPSPGADGEPVQHATLQS